MNFVLTNTQMSITKGQGWMKDERNKMCLLKTHHDRRSSSVGDLLVHEMSDVDRLTVTLLNETCRCENEIMLEGGAGQRAACRSDRRSIGHKNCRQVASLRST
jgi:hypothetical protein